MSMAVQSRGIACTPSPEVPRAREMDQIQIKDADIKELKLCEIEMTQEVQYTPNEKSLIKHFQKNKD